MRRSLTQKRMFRVLLFITTILLAVLPFITSFNNLITRIFTQNELYVGIESVIAPFTIKIVSVVVNLLGIKTLVFRETIHLAQNNGEWFSAYISWNCIGWQSFILLLVTILIGLAGNYTFISKMEAIIIGLFGTFLVNIARITLVVLIGWLTTPLGAIIFHDYFSTFIIIAWLFVFWWFSFSYVLESKTND